MSYNISVVQRLVAAAGLLLMILAVYPGAAAAQSADGLQSYLEGRLTVDPEVDDTEDYSGFEVLVMQDQQGEPDTLGYAATDETGHFAMDITAPERGLYPMIISRHGQILNVSDLVVADGDSGEVSAELPVPDGTIRVRSTENAAWMAYENTMSQHNRTLFERLQEEVETDEDFSSGIQLTASMLWNMQESFPGTVGAELAAAESIVMLEGWDDELVLERAETIPGDAPGYTEVARAASRAKARLDGQEEAIELLQRFIERTDNDERRATIRAEIVQVHLDNEQEDQARAAVEELRTHHPESEWVDWGERALYQYENLRPGMPAPSISVTTLEGEEVSLEDYRGQVVLLEFMLPHSSIFQRELETRAALYDAMHEEGFEILTVSLEPDEAINEALFTDRNIPGVYTIDPSGTESDLADSYNLMNLPMRYLIDEEGNIVSSYVEGAMMAIAEDVTALLGVDEVDLPAEEADEQP